MPSILPTFEYDIFISYRQNDNRSGWVTEFVKALQEELATTIKNPVSVYFDTNPHDGLLETHQVDKTLEGKLKCLIFIPIISQTYCDPKSFAWQHEFCAFNNLSKADHFGRDIRLANGNVVSRILPVKIHDLDVEDKNLLETELGGVLRAIDFIFKSAGVNRPLRAIEEHAQDNQNKNFYRDQINKVANAIKEMMAAFKSVQNPHEENSSDASMVEEKPKTNRSKRIVTLIVLIVLAVTLWLYFSPKLNSSQTEVAENDRSVAVLAFADLSPNKDQEWFSDGLTEEILNSLANLRELKVTARTSSFYFKGKDVPFQEIAEKLGVAHIVEGSVRRNGQELRITVQLIRSRDGFHIWSKTYDRTPDDVFKVQSDIAENIAKALLMTLTPDESKLVASQSKNIEAYEYYLKGYKIHSDKLAINGKLADFEEAERYFKKSISLDPGYGDVYGALADLYDTRSNIPKDRVKYWRLRDSTMTIGLRLNPRSVQVHVAYGWSFFKRDRPNYDSAFHHFRMAYEIAPNDGFAASGVGRFYAQVGLNVLAIKFMKRSLQLDPLSIRINNYLGFRYIDSGMYAESKELFLKVLELDPNNVVSHRSLGILSALEGDQENLLKRIATLEKIDTGRALKYLESLSLALQGKKNEALKMSKNYNVYAILGMKSEVLSALDSACNSNIRPPNPTALATDSFYGFLREDPRFKVIVQKAQRLYDENMKRFPPPD